MELTMEDAPPLSTAMSGKFQFEAKAAVAHERLSLSHHSGFTFHAMTTSVLV